MSIKELFAGSQPGYHFDAATAATGTVLTYDAATALVSLQAIPPVPPPVIPDPFAVGAAPAGLNLEQIANVANTIPVTFTAAVAAIAGGGSVVVLTADLGVSNNPLTAANASFRSATALDLAYRPLVDVVEGSARIDINGVFFYFAVRLESDGIIHLDTAANATADATAATSFRLVYRIA